MTPKPSINQQIAEEAAEWAVRIDAGALNPAERESLANWLQASPVHLEELLLSVSLLLAAERLEHGAAGAVEQALQGQTAEVIPLSGAAPAVERKPAAERRRQHRSRKALIGPMAVAAALAMFLVVAPVLFAPSADTDGAQLADGAASAGRLVETEFGEQRSLVLEDGSVLYLNTDSQVRVSLSDELRRIDLLRGEVLFEVAHDPARPFRVHAGDTLAQAVGTQFNVRRTSDAVSVVVVEGKVLVESRSHGPAIKRAARAGAGQAADEPLLLVAGKRVDLAAPGARPLISSADIASATSWRMRQVSFTGEGLGAIADEFNRYNRERIVLADRALANLRFTGVFDADDPASFLGFLELTGEVRVDRTNPERIVLRPAQD